MANPGADMFSVSLSRPNSSVSWGFRLQGGADFSTPLSIQLVQPNSVAETSGLQAGDAILQVNGLATETLDHESAKMEIIRAGNQIEFLVQRGAVTAWRPKVTPMSELKPSELQTHTLPGEAPPMQKTSLASNLQPMKHVGSSHNRSARPFGAAGGSSVAPETHISIRDSFPDSASHPDAHGRNQLQQEYLQECGGQVPNIDYNVQQSVRQQHPGPSSPGTGVMHAQYNTPLGIYSNNNVNNSFQQQVGVMKDDFGNMSMHDDLAKDCPNIQNNNNNGYLKPVSAPSQPSDRRGSVKSPVQIALEQEEYSDAGLGRRGSSQSKSFKILEQELDVGGGNSTNETNRVLPAGVKSVQAPKTNMKMTGPRYKQPTTKCYVCNNFITGVFVRVKDYCLHSECLKCAQCNRNLKNIGYIWVQDKIYCVQHARELTRPPGGGYTAYVIDAPEA